MAIRRILRAVKRRLSGSAPVSVNTSPAGPAAVASPSILDQYVTSVPSAQNAIDIFKGEWSSRLPDALGVQAGAIELFDDKRVAWFLEVMGGASGRKVLELGPLEAGHTYMFERAGAAEIVAVESNVRAYLKCLIAKELLGIERARFLCGDFLEYLRTTSDVFDVCLASGVLYHMQNPAELIALLARRGRGFLCLWTHYYDEKIITSTPRFAKKFVAAEPREFEGFRHTLHRQEYQAALQWAGFCGAGATTSHWMSRQDLLRCLEHFGWQVVSIGFEQPDHQNGPALALVAKKR